MAEMTVGEAIFALHKNGVILSNSIKRQIATLLDSQAAEIERLKCCGNCTYYETICGEGKCFAACDELPASRYDKKAVYAEGNGKCDKWEAQHD